jgi:BirA family biotin operon repressor/biotin-[acetyl-CoA-carboxylase] ligase
MIVQALKDAQAAGVGEYVSGEELARRTAITRAAIWKHIKNLKSRGYDIEAVRHQGYRLVATPDSLSPEQITPLLMGSPIGANIVYRKTVDSTNDLAKELAEKGAPEGTVVIAEEQTSGKGRLDRGWVSPPGGIWLSVILRPETPLMEAARFTLLAAVAAAKTIEALGLMPEIKWPNDILLDGRKVSGILLELNGQLGKVNYLVIGFGINANIDEDLLPPEIRAGATTLRACTSRIVDRRAIAVTLLTQLEDGYRQLTSGGWDAVLAEWTKRCRMIGRTVRLATFHGNIDGEFTGIDEFGALVLRLPGGQLKTFSAGDVTLL